jgi:hypothetical protein
MRQKNNNEYLSMTLKVSFLTHLFFVIMKPWFTIVTFDMRYSTSYADPCHKMQEHLPTAPGALSLVNPPSTNRALRCLTSVIKWVPLGPTWQDDVLTTFKVLRSPENCSSKTVRNCLFLSRQRFWLSVWVTQ